MLVYAHSATFSHTFLMATKVTSSLINTISASQITAVGATAGQVLTYNGSTSTWVASAAPAPATSSNAFAAKAWVSFDATRNAAGGTDSLNTNRYIRAGYNVSSVLMTSTGDYDITFTTPMASAEYCVVGNGGNMSNTCLVVPHARVAPTANTFTIQTVSVGATQIDYTYVHVVVFA